MKAFPFQHFTLVITLAFVCGAPVEKQDIRAMLKNIWNKASEIHVNSSVRVERITHGQKLCVPNFFCMAQKALENKSLQVLEKLTRQLNVYNNATQRTNCTLPHKGETTLHCLLNDVVKCVNRTIKKINK